MIEQINDRIVEIDGKRFPAVNIQVFDCSPELFESECGFPDSCTVWFGIYFEIMFESGYNLSVFQEAVLVAAGNSDRDCTLENLDHFIVEHTRAQEDHRRILYRVHCIGESDLIHEISKVMRDQSWIDGAGKLPLTRAFG